MYQEMASRGALCSIMEQNLRVGVKFVSFRDDGYTWRPVKHKCFDLPGSICRKLQLPFSAQRVACGFYSDSFQILRGLCDSLEGSTCKALGSNSSTTKLKQNKTTSLDMFKFRWGSSAVRRCLLHHLVHEEEALVKD